MIEHGGTGELVERARRLASAGQDLAATEAYLEVLRRDPQHCAALNEIGVLAYAGGHVSAARTAYEHAVRWHPANPLARVNLGNLLYEADEFAAARAQFEAALAVRADFAPAHQGLARTLTEQGEIAAAERHRRIGFTGHAVVTRPCRGTGAGVPVVLLVSAMGGNVPTRRQILDERMFAVSAVYAEFYDPAQPLPPHRIVFNSIGDADLSPRALACAEAIVAHSAAPVINPPSLVRLTGRVENARRLADVPGVIAPSTRAATRAQVLRGEGLRYPFLLRAPGFHTGRHFLRVAHERELAGAVATLPTDELLVIDYLDARGADGLSRKYRVMLIDGALYPVHLAISPDWKVHYFTADMAGNAMHRAEEGRFLDDMPSVLGPRAMAALAGIGQRLGLDYAGIDFGLGPAGEVLLFEANAPMVINRPDPDPIWDYRRAALNRAHEAARRMLLTRC